MESAKRPSDPTTDSSTPKRRQSTASAAGEITFRVLCPSDKTGAVIGKGGSIISRIRDETRSRIRIEDPVPGCDDRVILITADASPKDHADVLSSQMALVRVFERIEGVDEGKEAASSPAMCRLLVCGNQVGSVLGKGGKIVERIRGESGAQIRILGKEQLPACAGAGDELIHVRKL